MEAPEKIWINPSIDLSKLNGIIDKDSVQYTRTDAFIDRIINFLNYKLDDIVAIRVHGTIIPHHVAKQELIDDLKNTLKEMIDESNKLLALERKACITKTIEWFFIQLNEGDMECGNIEKFVDNYRKYMEE